MKPRDINVLSMLLLLLACASTAHAQLVVHEWGTMTTLHAADGRAQNRLNLIDHDAALPSFVHHFEPHQSDGVSFAPFIKGSLTPGRPDVAMRLETPVLYFYDPGNVLGEQRFDVRVHMRAGILNDFYPLAGAKLMRHGNSTLKPGTTIALDRTWTSSLEWRGVRLDGAAPVQKTSAAVWLAPRQVKASKLVVGNEGEHYLFYRGLANVTALIATRHSASSVQLGPPRDRAWILSDTATMARVWLVDVQPNGAIAFAARDSLTIDKTAPVEVLAVMPRFKANEFSAARGAALRESMQSSLVSAGLFADEAAAMLRTWDASYFRKPGLRVFYMVPRDWTDHYLPLELSVPHEATRVLIGRIDLMTADETT